MNLYRAWTWRGRESIAFDPLDSSGSVAGPRGWRFNDVHTEILYAAEVESLAVLELTVRPGWETVQQVIVATLEIPDASVANPSDLGIVLPSNWNARPIAEDSRSIGREFLDAVSRLPAGAMKPLALRVPSVMSGSDCNVLIDPLRKRECVVRTTHRIPFRTPLRFNSQTALSRAN